MYAVLKSMQEHYPSLESVSGCLLVARDGGV